MSHIEKEIVTITTVGSAGSAVGSGVTEAYDGFLLQVDLNYHASAPATTDVTLTYAKQGGAILTVSNNATDAVKAPRQEICNNAGVAQGLYDYFPTNEPISIAVAQCDALTGALVATLWFLVV